MISVEHLSKRYGDVLAVDDLSFTIEDGHIYGFLGPNGAGKSTTLNIMTGCLAATSGEIKIDGHDIYEEEKEAKRLIGYLPEIPPLYVEQTPREYLQFVAEAKGVAKADLEQEIDRVIEETHIEEMQNRLIKHLSKGYRQRVGIAQALLNNPSVIILDEPTVGLDPMQIIEIRELIAELGKKHTVILSSHILSEIQAICEKVLIIYKGKLVAFDDIENLGKTLSSGNEIEIMTEANEDEVLGLAKSLGTITNVEPLEDVDGYHSYKLYTESDNPYEACKQVFNVFASNSTTLIRLNPIQTTLEDIFIELTTIEQEAEIKEREAIEVQEEDEVEEKEAN
ncbi:MAG: ABC transporter ATP-binding protein [Pseudobutyrivibrio sp.]|nr:ABC transporter ATP-binding protein [Pseudobutyrivibrio sp.]